MNSRIGIYTCISREKSRKLGAHASGTNRSEPCIYANFSGVGEERKRLQTGESFNQDSDAFFISKRDFPNSNTIWYVNRSVVPTRLLGAHASANW